MHQEGLVYHDALDGHLTMLLDGYLTALLGGHLAMLFIFLDESGTSGVVIVLQKRGTGMEAISRRR